MSLEPSLEGVGDGVGELDDSARERGDFIAELEEEVSEWGAGRDKLSVREGRKAAGERALAALQEAEAGREAAKKIQADNDQLRRQLLENYDSRPARVGLVGAAAARWGVGVVAQLEGDGSGVGCAGRALHVQDVEPRTVATHRNNAAVLHQAV